MTSTIRANVTKMRNGKVAISTFVPGSALAPQVVEMDASEAIGFALDILNRVRVVIEDDAAATRKAVSA